MLLGKAVNYMKQRGGQNSPSSSSSVNNKASGNASDSTSSAKDDMSSDSLKRQTSETGISDNTSEKPSETEDSVNDYSRTAEEFRTFRKQNDFYDNDDSIQVISVDENERFDPKTNTWSSSNLLASDPLK
jgi:hypothetical protein